jgi:hypothetical protein
MQARMIFLKNQIVLAEINTMKKNKMTLENASIFEY